jgi:hypothetical protein
MEASVCAHLHEELVLRLESRVYCCFISFISTNTLMAGSVQHLNLVAARNCETDGNFNQTLSAAPSQLNMQHALPCKKSGITSTSRSAHSGTWHDVKKVSVASISGKHQWQASIAYCLVT